MRHAASVGDSDSGLKATVHTIVRGVGRLFLRSEWGGEADDPAGSGGARDDQRRWCHVGDDQTQVAAVLLGVTEYRGPIMSRMVTGAMSDEA